MVHILGFLQEVCGDGAQDSLHHGKMLFTVVSLKEKTILQIIKNAMVNVTVVIIFIKLSAVRYLEESRSKVVLNEYAAYTPDITGMVPAKI